MYRCLIVADDLTGANASGILLRPFGINPITLAAQDRGESGLGLGGMDALIISTDSRSLSPDDAYVRVRKAVLEYADPAVRLYTKRIDSTLRGNVGIEIDAMLDVLAERENAERIAVVVPAYPQAGRVMIGGYILVNGIPLERSDAGRDPKAPVSTSLATDIVGRGSKWRIGHIPLAAISSGSSKARKALRDAYSRGERVCVFDAVQPEDIETIAEAVIAAELPFIAADPGPFTAALAGRLLRAEQAVSGSHILIAVGSVVETAIAQLKEIYRSRGVAHDYLDPMKLLEEKNAEAEIERSIRILAKASGEAEILCITTNSLNPAAFLDLESIARERASDKDAISNIINEGLASAVELALERIPSIKGLYLSGGDATMAILHRFGAAGLALEREIMPLAVLGRVVGGRLSGMPVVTKGGMVGDKDAINLCVRHLREKISASKSP